jgi:hypothetical protein
MRFRLTMLCLLAAATLVGLSSNGSAGVKTPPVAPEPLPKPNLQVSMLHSAIRENDSFPVTVWFSNDSDLDFSAAELQISSPEFLKWHDGPCPGKDLQGPLALGPVPAHKVISRSLCPQSDSTIEVGGQNIFFTVRFSWKGCDGRSRESFASIEKALNVALLGTDTLGGVPLGIASLVMPGLLFWMFAKIWGVAWGPGLALGENLIYSVLCSALIIVALSFIWPYFDLKSGISIQRLLLLAVAGASVGFVVGFVDWLARRAQQEKKDAQTVRLGDDGVTALGKLLRLFGRKQVIRTGVRLRDGRQYVGSLGEERSDLVTLVGWFQVNTNDAARVAELRPLLTAGKYSDAFDVAARHGLQITLVDSIKVLQDDGSLGPTGWSIRYWKPGDVEEVVPAPGAPQRAPVALP